MPNVGFTIARSEAISRSTDRPSTTCGLFPFSRVCFISHFLFLLSRVLHSHSFPPPDLEQCNREVARGCTDGARRRRTLGWAYPTYSSLHWRISAGTFERLRAGVLEQLVRTVVAAGYPRVRSAAPSPSGGGFRRLRPHLAGGLRRRRPVQGKTGP